MTKRGRKTTAVAEGPCPTCGALVQTPVRINQCAACGQWVVNRGMYLGSKFFLYSRRAPNKAQAPQRQENPNAD